MILDQLTNEELERVLLTTPSKKVRQSILTLLKTRYETIGYIQAMDDLKVKQEQAIQETFALDVDTLFQPFI